MAAPAVSMPPGWKPNLRAGALYVALERIMRNSNCGWVRTMARRALADDRVRKAKELLELERQAGLR